MVSNDFDSRLPAQLPLTAENHRVFSKSAPDPSQPGLWLYKDFNGNLELRDAKNTIRLLSTQELS